MIVSIEITILLFSFVRVIMHTLLQCRNDVNIYSFQILPFEILQTQSRYIIRVSFRKKRMKNEKLSFHSFYSIYFRTENCIKPIDVLTERRQCYGVYSPCSNSRSSLITNSPNCSSAVYIIE